ncbi:hypothetical protein ACWDSL_43780, partial [Streptomyces sp. NPDC000941]
APARRSPALAALGPCLRCLSGRLRRLRLPLVRGAGPPFARARRPRAVPAVPAARPSAGPPCRPDRPRPPPSGCWYAAAVR